MWTLILSYYINTGISYEFVRETKVSGFDSYKSCIDAGKRSADLKVYQWEFKQVLFQCKKVN